MLSLICILSLQLEFQKQSSVLFSVVVIVFKESFRLLLLNQMCKFKQVALPLVLNFLHCEIRMITRSTSWNVVKPWVDPVEFTELWLEKEGSPAVTVTYIISIISSMISHVLSLA